MKKRYKMPRPRKYDYKKDYPVKKVIYVKLTVEIAETLELLGYYDSSLSKLVENYLIEFVENNRKKD
jgi:hypothetical protein